MCPILHGEQRRQRGKKEASEGEALLPSWELLEFRRPSLRLLPSSIYTPGC